MCRCIAEDVWLQPLADKFVRLALQLLARFAVWLAAGINARSSVGAAAAAAPPPDNADPAQPSSQVLAIDSHHLSSLLLGLT